MAPLPLSKYLPPIDKCLNAEEIPICWKSVFSIITKNPKDIHDIKSVEGLLSEQEVLNILSKPFNAYSPPSAQTKVVFETKTSAINVIPSSDSRYDIKQIKEDTLWLSKEVTVDEVTALRIVILECYSRTAALLGGPFSEEEVASLQEASGNNKLSNSIPQSLLPQGFRLATIQNNFEKLESRKLRILQTFLSEKRFLWKCSEHLLFIFFVGLDRELEEKVEDRDKSSITKSWLSERAKALARSLQSIGSKYLILELIIGVRNSIRNLGSGSGFFNQQEFSDELKEDWIQTQITEATLCMKIIWYILHYTIELPSSQFVMEWFQLLQSFEFFDQFGSGDAYFETLLLPLKVLSTVISVELLENLNPLLVSNDPKFLYQVSSEETADKPFILSPQSIFRLHKIILQAAESGYVTAGPAILTWSILIQAISLRVDTEKETKLIDDDGSEVLESIGSEHANSPYGVILQSIQNTVDDNVIDYLALRAVNVCHVFDTISAISDRLGNTNNSLFFDSIGAQMRNVFLQLVKKSIDVGYIPEIVCANISALTGGSGYWELVNSIPHEPLDSPIMRFLNDDILDGFLKISQSRFPYEPLPFLQFIRALAPSSLWIGSDDPKSLFQLLEVIPVFTFTLPIDFADYETTMEEDNNNNVILKKNLHLFEPRIKNHLNYENSSKSMSVISVDQEFLICAGTLGRIISESGPRVACWFHQYSALKYFGKLLETFLAASDQVDGTTGMSADPESVGEIIEILAVLVNNFSRSTTKTQNGVESASKVLEVASSGLNRNRDIITVIFDIFEEGLQTISSRSGPSFPLQILINCVHFIHAILPLSPSRVWPLIARSGILGVTKDAESLPNIVEGVERQLGRFDFLLSCAFLFESLLDDFIANALRRKINRQSSANFAGVQNVETGSPDQFVSKILLSFTRYLVDVFENSCCWKYQFDDDRQSLSRVITTIFDQILLYCYGTEVTSISSTFTDTKSRPPEEKVNQPLLGALKPAAVHIVECFLSTSSGNLRFQPLLRSYLDGLESSETKFLLQKSNLWKKYVVSSLSFSRTLLRVNVLLERPASQLEKLLFNCSPLIARLYCSDDEFSIPVVLLLESLVFAATNHEAEPPSLLGHLGPHTARNFLQALSNLDKPLSRFEHLQSTWHFLGTVVSGRQKWFSNFLLTGKTPRDALKSKSSRKEMTILEQPLLNTALKNLTSITEISSAESLAILGFVALAQNFWPWIVCNASNYPDFIKSILDFTGNLTPPQLRQGGNIAETIKTFYQTKIAASVAEILAMHLFHSRQTGSAISLKELLPNLTYYERFGITALDYNASLHGLLMQNFESRYPGCTGRDFKRTTFSDFPYGKDYFYDLQLADKMLHLDQAWTGRNGDDGMRSEFERANVNLSLVDAQIALFKSWKLLSLELSGWISIGPELQKIFCKVIAQSLMVNCKTQPPEEIFCRLLQSRAEFALVLTQRLLKSKSTDKELSGLLKAAWMTICELRGGFDRPVLDCDSLYYRSLLKLLYLTICVHSKSKPEGDEDPRKNVCFSEHSYVIPTVIEVIKYVVSRGLREIVTCIHEPGSESSPEDLVLITGILQSCLRLPNISTSHSQIASILISDGTSSVALRLFSWSDRLAIDGDPVYGELSILFLLELSSIPLMAEQLAIEGLLTHISSASIMSHLQNDRLGNFNDVGYRRCCSIWARGILPLILNILDTVQQSIAVEVAQFLNQFPALLRQSEKSFEAPLMNRLPDHGPKGQITLTACSGAHSMALIVLMLNGFRESLKGTIEIPLVKWDSNAVLENVEFWLSSRAMLRERLLPTNEREVEMLRVKEDNSTSINLLEEKVVAQMIGIREVLSGSHMWRFGFGVLERSCQIDVCDGRNVLDLRNSRKN